MEFIRSYATLLCVALIITEIAVFLIPDGNSKKTAQTVIALILMLSVTSFFSEKADLKLNENFIENNEIPAFDDNFNDYLIDSSKQVAEDIITSNLEDICQERFNVKTAWHTEENQVILDKIQVQITTTDAAKISVIKSRLNGVTGLVPEVNISEF